jgi:ketosteroid isomerase-like protein
MATLASSGDAPQTSLSVQVEPTLPCGSPRRERPNRRDFDAFGDLFANDGIWEIGEPFPRRAAGRQNVVTMFRNLSEPWDFFFQTTHTGVIDVAPDHQTATARWEMREIARTPDGSQSYDNVAMYYDRLARTQDGSWRFAERRYYYIWLCGADLVGRSIPRPDDPA